MTPVERVLHFVTTTAWTDLPPAVQHQARRCLLDGMAALIAGTQTPVARLMADLAATQWAGNEATLLADGRRASPTGATLANGFAANALDIDDGYRPIKGHPGVCVLPALLAAAEVRAVSGAEFLTALVIGYEVAIRAGLIRHATATTYHASGSWGAIAAAAAVGKLFGLDPATLCEAMGTAEYHAPIAPMMKGIARPSIGKDGTGWGAMVGMAAVLMAQKGFTGVRPLFDETPNPEWISSLGRRYEIERLYFKRYTCCRWTQPVIAASLALAQEHRLQPDHIARIHVRSFAAAARLSRGHPQNTEEAQYNLAFPVAAALGDGELGPQQVLPPRLYDPQLLALADRLTVEVHDEYEAAFPAKAYADVTITTLDGRTFSSGRYEAPWEPPAVPTDAELEAKFRCLVVPILGEGRTDELAKLIWAYDHTPLAAMLPAAVVPGHEQTTGPSAANVGCIGSRGL